MRLEHKRAVLTGAGSGIGAAFARKFAAEGCAVAMLDIDGTRAQTIADDIAAGGATAFAFACDVADEAALAEAFAECEARLGGIDILVNNAGIVHDQDGDVTQTPVNAWESTLAVNLTAVFLGCKHGLPALMRQGGGAILNTASIVAHLGPSPSQSAYAASKGAVVAMTREIAVCYARRGIRANAICPGPTATEMVRQVMGDDGVPERNRAHMPMGRLGLPDEIAAAAAYLVSDEASYITGQAVNVDGGLTGAYLCPQG